MCVARRRARRSRSARSSTARRSSARRRSRTASTTTRRRRRCSRLRSTSRRRTSRASPRSGTSTTWAQHPHRVRPEEPPRAVLHDEARLRARQADGHVPHGEPGGRCPVGPVAARGRGALAKRNGARAHTAVVVRVGRVGLAQENGRGGGGSLGRSFGRLFGQGSSGSRARPASQRVVSFSSEQSSLSPASESSRAAAASYSPLSLALSLRRLARACGTSSTPSPSSRPRARSRTFTTRATSASRASKNQTGGGGAAVRGASQPSRHVRACERRGARGAGRRRTRGVWTRGRARVAVRDARSGKMAGRRRVSK